MNDFDIDIKLTKVEAPTELDEYTKEHLKILGKYSHDELDQMLETLRGPIVISEGHDK